MHVQAFVIRLLMVLSGAIMCAACSSGGSDIIQSVMTSQSSSKDVARSAPSIVVAVAPIIGPPAAFLTPLWTDLDRAASSKKVALLKDPDARGDYVLRGNFLASSDANGAYLSYIWDVYDAKGVRTGRVTGEERAPLVPGAANAWASIPPGATKVLADKAMAALAPHIVQTAK